MADINVERRGPNIWPWIIGLIVLALIIWLLTQTFRGDDRGAAPATTDTIMPADTPRGIGAGVGVGTPPTTVAPGTQQPPRP